MSFIDLNNKNLIKISQGSYGIVYKFTYENNTYAVKVYNSFTLDESCIKEINYLLNLSHPNIIKLIHCFYSNEFIGVLFPFYDINLNDWIINHECYDHDHTNKEIQKTCPSNLKLSHQIKFIMKEIAKGVDYLHKNNILHRDIKEHNILITNKTKDPVKVVICDFGLSIRKPSTNFDVYTITHRAPEVIREEFCSFPADIWAMGCVFIALLSGITPYFTINEKTSDEVKLNYIKNKLKNTIPVVVNNALLNKLCSKMLCDYKYRLTSDEVLQYLTPGVKYDYNGTYLKNNCVNYIKENNSQQRMIVIDKMCEVGNVLQVNKSIVVYAIDLYDTFSSVVPNETEINIAIVFVVLSCKYLEEYFEMGVLRKKYKLNMQTYETFEKQILKLCNYNIHLENIIDKLDNLFKTKKVQKLMQTFEEKTKHDLDELYVYKIKEDVITTWIMLLHSKYVRDLSYDNVLYFIIELSFELDIYTKPVSSHTEKLFAYLTELHDMLFNKNIINFSI